MLSSGLNIYNTVACPLISQGFKCGWSPTVTMGATRRKPLSHDTDTGGGVGARWPWGWSKINVSAIPVMPVFTSRRRRAGEEKEGLIGEGFWELRAGQRERSGRRKDEVRGKKNWMDCEEWEVDLSLTPLTPLPSYLLRWIIKHDRIKQNKLTGNVHWNMREIRR